MTPKITKLIILTSALLPLAASALESDRRQPIEIEADQGSLDKGNQNTVFSGNVIIKQGSLNIRADSVQVSRDEQGNQRMQASGRPVRFGQTLDGGKGEVKGQANRVQYASNTGVVTLSGNAKVSRGGDRAEGETIVYNTRSEVYTVKGSKAAGMKGRRRVTVVIQPQNK